MEGLTDVITKRNIPFAEYPTYKKIKEIGKAVGIFSNAMCVGYMKGHLERLLILVQPCIRKQTTCLAASSSVSPRDLQWDRACNGCDSFCRALLWPCLMLASCMAGEGGEGRGGHCSMVCVSCLAGFLLPPFIHLY